MIKHEKAPIIIEPDKKANASVIWLHGLGADANDFLPVVEQLNFPGHQALRFVLPNAPVRSISLNNGVSMQGWYDIFGIGPEYPEDEKGIHASCQYIESLIENELQQGINANRIILIGFSQGGAVALHTGLRYQQTLAAVLALSTYLPLRHSVVDEVSAEQMATPFMFMHGTHDNVVPIDFADYSYKKLQNTELNVLWKEYPMEHTVCLQQIQDINRFLVELLD